MVMVMAVFVAVIMFMVMIVIMVVIIVVIMTRMALFSVILPAGNYCDLCSGDAVPLILHYIQFPTFQVKTGETVGKSLPGYSQVKHCAEVHIAADA